MYGNILLPQSSDCWSLCANDHLSGVVILTLDMLRYRICLTSVEVANEEIEFAPNQELYINKQCKLVVIVFLGYLKIKYVYIHSSTLKLLKTN